MTFRLSAGIEISIDGTTWYKLTDHNRQEIDITSTLIEKEMRVANGSLRKFVVAKKDTISTSWEFLPTHNNNISTATLISGGAMGSNSMIVSNINANVGVGDVISATGLQPNTKITEISGTVVGGADRVSVKFSPQATSQVSGTISFFYKDLIVDGNYSASWLTAFYNANAGTPIYVKLVASKHTDPAIGQVPTANTYVSASTGTKIYQAFITNFNKTIRKRTTVTDYVDMTIEFTEI